MQRLALTLTALCGAAAGMQYCQPGEACWPTASEISALEAELNPNADRWLVWKWKTPYNMAVSIGSPLNQPLDGLGTYPGISALYVRTAADVTYPCFTQYAPNKWFVPDFCRAATRCNPLEGWMPAFVAFPQTVAHVQAVVRFAVAHKVCVSVAGTGSDYNNRHTCNNGVMVRLSLMKDLAFDLEDVSGYGWADGNVRFGPGFVNTNLQYEAAARGRAVSTSFGAPVGMGGWTLGGGHGVIAPSAGLGADNLLSADVVLANGSLVTANKTHNADLYRALRGGGGSTWGVVVSLTVRTHPIPTNGYASSETVWEGSACPDDAAAMKKVVSAWQAWSVVRGAKWSGLMTITPSLVPAATGCKRGKFVLTASYVYAGSPQEPEYVAAMANLTAVEPAHLAVKASAAYKTLWDYRSPQPPQFINPTGGYAPSNVSAGGAPSVLVSRGDAVKLPGVLHSVMDTCISMVGPSPPADTSLCGVTTVFHDLTGNVGSPQEEDVAISADFRTAVYHLLLLGRSTKALNSVTSALGSASTCFGLSAYDMANYSAAYWGDNVEFLQRVKKDVDPSGFFSCRHCIAPSP